MTGAFLVRTHGGPDAMEWTEHDPGQPGPGEVRIRHTAIGLNFIDTYQRSGLYPMKLPFVPGNEGAGRVLAIGEGVEGIAIGDRLAYQGVAGAYAEERLLPVSRAVAIPDDIDDETAASVLLKGLTAYYLLHLTWPLKAGETILFHAAAGGTGLIACQWAAAIGATVIGTAGSDEKVALARENGCAHVINYRSEDFVARVRELTGGRGVDVVYDSVGKDTFERSLDCLRPRGLMVSFGNSTGPVAVPDLGILARKGSLFLTRPTGAGYFQTRADTLSAADALWAIIRSGKVRVHIGQRFAL
ncbi:MAG: quinone oxidoreductase family protein, partial [Devosia sp.]